MVRGPNTRAGESAESLELSRRAAESGDADRQAEYARKLLSLRGRDGAEEARAFLRRAAQQGHLEAQHLLGELLYSSKLVERNEAEASLWLHLAAQNGDKEAGRTLKELELFADGAAFSQGKKRAAEFQPVLEVREGQGLLTEVWTARKARDYGNKVQALAMVAHVGHSPDAPGEVRAEALVLEGHLLREQGRLSEALEAYTSTLAIKEAQSQHHSEAQVWVGHVLEGQGTLNEAIEAYRKVFTIKDPNPHHLSEAGAALGGVYLRLKDYSHAKAEFERVLALPEPVPVYANQAKQGLEEISRATNP